VYGVLRIITLGKWPFESFQYGQVSLLLTVLGTGIPSVSLASPDTFLSLVSTHTCSLDILPSLPVDLICPTCSLTLVIFPHLVSMELAPSNKETVLPASPDTPPSLALGIPSPTCSLVPVKCPPLAIFELGPEVEAPSPPSKGQVPDSIPVPQAVQHHSLLTLVASTEKWHCLIPIRSCSLDTPLSLVFDMQPTVLIPSCFPDILFPIVGVLPGMALSISSAPVPPFCPVIQPCKKWLDVYNNATPLSSCHQPTLKLPMAPLGKLFPPSLPMREPILGVEL